MKVSLFISVYKYWPTDIDLQILAYRYWLTDVSVLAKLGAIAPNQKLSERLSADRKQSTEAAEAADYSDLCESILFVAQSKS